MRKYNSLIELEAAIEEKKQLEKSNLEKERRQYRHDWKIAWFGAVGGAVAGGIVSTVFWLIQLLAEKQ